MADWMSAASHRVAGCPWSRTRTKCRRSMAGFLGGFFCFDSFISNPPHGARTTSLLHATTTAFYFCVTYRFQLTPLNFSASSRLFSTPSRRRGACTMASSSPLSEPPSSPPRTPSRDRSRKRGSYDPSTPRTARRLRSVPRDSPGTTRSPGREASKGKEKEVTTPLNPKQALREKNDITFLRCDKRMR